MDDEPVAVVKSNQLK